MRYRKPYQLTKRCFGHQPIYYYRVFDENNKRRTYTTGMTTKGAAMAYCDRLYKLGKLIPDQIKDSKFSDFAKDFWDYDTSPYIKGIIARCGSFTRNFADIRKMCSQKHIIPYFGDKVIRKITARDVEKWLLSFIDRGLSGATANQNLTTLRIMLNEAIKAGLAEKNPCESIKPLKKNPKERGILTQKEVYTLMNPKTAPSYWENKLVFLGNCLAAVTGLRKGEILALKAEDVCEDHIIVSHSYDKFGEKDTKTHKKREIPIPGTIYDMIKKLAPKKGYIFSYDGGITPVDGEVLTNALYKALEKMGMSKEERKERNICFHSWRHFFNTRLRSANIADSKTQSITGHSTMEMTEHYTHFRASDFIDVLAVQEAVLVEPEKEEVDKGNG